MGIIAHLLPVRPARCSPHAGTRPRRARSPGHHRAVLRHARVTKRERVTPGSTVPAGPGVRGHRRPWRHRPPELERAGLKVQWNGTFAERIYVPEMSWKRRPIE